jgi:threonine synthase
MLRAVREIAQAEGVVTSPEGGATLAALELLRDQGLVSPPESVVLFLTGSGYKYLEAMEAVAQGSVVPATRVAPPGS